jgi:hypothetical protein
MTITTGTARRLLRRANPAPNDAHADAADGPAARSTLTAILGSGAAVSPVPAQRRWLATPRWRVAIPAAALAAALAGGLAAALVLTDAPAPGSPYRPDPAASGAFATLIADLTAHPPASAGDASAELRALAAIAAAQPAPAALGPVEYTRAESWGLDLGVANSGLGYVSHNTSTQETWMGSDGAYLGVETFPGGKVPPGLIPVQRSGPSAQGAAGFARWYNPATLPASESLMRQHLLGMACANSFSCTSGDQTPGVVTSAEALMGSEPLPPAARAAILRVLAAAAASPGPRQAFYDLGSVTDRAGHKAVAIAYENQQQPAGPGTASGSCTTTTSGNSTVVTCSGSAGSSSTVQPSGVVGSSGTAGSSGTVGSGSTVQPSGTGQVPASPSGHVTKGSGVSSFMESSLIVLVFDPDTGALLGVEYAFCNAPVQARLATGSCSVESYEQYLEIRAVPSIPATPTAPPDTAPPDTAPTATAP